MELTFEQVFKVVLSIGALIWGVREVYRNKEPVQPTSSFAIAWFLLLSFVATASAKGVTPIQWSLFSLIVSLMLGFVLTITTELMRREFTPWWTALSPGKKFGVRMATAGLLTAVAGILVLVNNQPSSFEFLLGFLLAVIGGTIIFTGWMAWHESRNPFQVS